MSGVNGDKVGIAAAIGQCANPVAQLPLALASAKYNNLARNLKAEKFHDPFGRWITTAALYQIRTVHTCGIQAD